MFNNYFKQKHFVKGENKSAINKNDKKINSKPNNGNDNNINKQ